MLPPQRGVRKAVFPAAGLGTRMLPATKALPKEMLTVVDQPVIQYGVEEAVASGLTHVILVTAARKGAIEDHFDSSPELERILEQKGDRPRWPPCAGSPDWPRSAPSASSVPSAWAMPCCWPATWSGDEPFAVFLPDDIMDGEDGPVTAQLLRVFAAVQGPVLSVERVPREHAPRYGILAVEPVAPPPLPGAGSGGEAGAWPAPSDLAIMGRYVLTRTSLRPWSRPAPAPGARSSSQTACAPSCASAPSTPTSTPGGATTAGRSWATCGRRWSWRLRRPDLGADFRRALEEVAGVRPGGAGESGG